MASQITHIVLADKLYRTHLAELDKRAFMVGNVFPDIRKLAGFDRRLTHADSTIWEELRTEKNAFRAGMKLHNVIDITREKYMRTQGLYELFSIRDNPLTAAKLFEDEILYGKLSDWQWVIHALDGIIAEERTLPATEEQIKAWHFMLQRYFSHPDYSFVRTAYIETIGIEPAWLSEAEAAIEQLRQSSRAAQLVENLYETVETLILEA